jgi:hypothetical protein
VAVQIVFLSIDISVTAVLRRIIEPKRKQQEARENCIIRNFITLYSSPNIIIVIISIKMR